MVLSTTVDHSLVAMVTYLCCHLIYDTRGGWHTVNTMLFSNYKSEMLPITYTIDKCDFLKSIIYSQII